MRQPPSARPPERRFHLSRPEEPRERGRRIFLPSHQVALAQRTSYPEDRLASFVSAPGQVDLISEQHDELGDAQPKSAGNQNDRVHHGDEFR